MRHFASQSRLTPLAMSSEKVFYQGGPAKIDLIINRINPKLVAKGDMLDSEDVLDILSIDLIGVVPEDPNIVGSTNRGQPLIFDSKTGAAGAYWRISERIEGKEVPIPEFKVDGAFTRFWGKLIGRRDGEIN